MNYASTGYHLEKSIFCSEVKIVREKINSVFRLYTKDYKTDFDSLVVQLFKSDFDGFFGCANVCQNLPELYNLCFHAEMMLLLKKLGIANVCMNTRPLISFSSKLTAKNDNYWRVPAHQDWPSTLGSLNGLTCWIPLVDLYDKDLGPLEISESSHLLGNLQSEDHGVPILTSEINLDFKPIFMGIGDILFFNNFVVHKSGDNVTDKIRLTLHFRYDDYSESTYIDRKFPRYRQDVRKPFVQNDNFPTIEQIKNALGL